MRRKVNSTQRRHHYWPVVCLSHKTVFVVRPWQCKPIKIKQFIPIHELFFPLSRLQHAKIVNLMYGTNVPKLINMITEELDIELKCRAGEVERKYYELHELTPEEQEREDAKRAIEENAERIEKEAAIKKRRDYIIHVFDEIMTNIPDMGITLFMPHVHKDVYKKMNENAEKHDLHFKEKRLVHLNPKMLEVLHFDCENPIEDDIFEHIFYKDVQAYVWKLQEDVSRTPEDVIADFVQFLTEPSEVLDADGNVEKVIPPLIEPLEMHYNQNDGTWKPLIKNPPKKGAKGAKPTPELAAATTSSASMSSSKETFDEESCPKMFIPGIWSPTNRRATAALFYLLFRHVSNFWIL